MSITSGTKLGRYEIRSQIGAGGMGEVYRASDPKIGRDVAINMTLIRRVRDDPPFRNLIKRLGCPSNASTIRFTIQDLLFTFISQMKRCPQCNRV